MALKIKSEQCGKCEINNYSKYNRNYWTKRHAPYEKIASIF